MHRADFQEATQDLQGALADLESLTHGSPVQQHRVRQLAPLLRARMEQLAASIERHRAHPGDVAQQAEDTRVGATMDRPSRRLLVEMGEQERLVGERHRRDATDQAWLSLRVIAGSGALAGAVLVGAATFLARAGAHRRAAEEAGARQRQLQESVVTQMGEGLVVTDAQGTFVVFNLAAERILGAGKLASSPSRWAEDYRFFRPDGATPFPSEELPLARALRGETSDGVEMHVASPQGGIQISASARPLRDAAGALTGAMVVFTNITERRKAMAQVEEANDRLRATVDRLQWLTAEKTLLAELGDVLHSCRTVEEGYQAAKQVAARLLPDYSGEVRRSTPPSTPCTASRPGRRTLTGARTNTSIPRTAGPCAAAVPTGPRTSASLATTCRCSLRDTTPAYPC